MRDFQGRRVGGGRSDLFRCEGFALDVLDLFCFFLLSFSLVFGYLEVPETHPISLFVGRLVLIILRKFYFELIILFFFFLVLGGFWLRFRLFVLFLFLIFVIVILD
jgi:hypothetical protein